MNIKFPPFPSLNHPFSRFPATYVLWQRVMVAELKRQIKEYEDKIERLLNQGAGGYGCVGVGEEREALKILNGVLEAVQDR